MGKPIGTYQDTPEATDRDRGGSEEPTAAVPQGVIFAGATAAVDHRGASTTQPPDRHLAGSTHPAASRP
ncbi:hypothetical protein [Streptomyces sp. NPDC096142]|uniref:hypothetical protein n=1 Tax=Streptomyces sp. NPDC096142 TaxID=3366077 RepID=UPI0038101248